MIYCGVTDECGFVVAAVSAPLLDVLASAAVEQPPLETPAAASASESQNTADGITEPMPTVLEDALAAHSTPVAGTNQMSLLGADELVAAPVDMATSRFLFNFCPLLSILVLVT